MDSDPSQTRILIFGGSTRAAAQSARRAGLAPLCADRFADDDLRQTAEVLATIDDWRDLVEIAAAAPSAPWIYTGAMENRPALVRRLEAVRPLLGNPHDVLRAVRNPRRLHAVLVRAGLPTLPVRIREAPSPDGAWLRKPVHGSGGRGIRVWDELAASGPVPREAFYFQKRASGKPISSLFVATRTGAALVGVCEQLIGAEGWFGRGFAYCGSLGPSRIPDSTWNQIRETGMVLARALRFRGLCGIDWILDGSTAWPTEVNPRYTASVEVYERTLGESLVRWHGRACETFDDPRASHDMTESLLAALKSAYCRHSDRRLAKAILYAPFDIRVPNLQDFGGSNRSAAAGVEIVDRPRPGTVVRRGSPLCTLLAPVSESVGLEGLDAAREELLAYLDHHRSGVPNAGRDGH